MLKLGLLVLAFLSTGTIGFNPHYYFPSSRKLACFSTAHSERSKNPPSELMKSTMKEPLGALTRIYKKREKDTLAAKPEPAFFMPTLDTERLNGRVAMVALVAIIAQEFWDGLSIQEQLDRLLCSVEHAVGC
jgi:hypothetical protein